MLGTRHLRRGIGTRTAWTMPVEPAEPLPIESVRDLLGIARALYRVAKDRGALAQAKELEAIGKQYRTALQLARETEPGTLGHRAAWQHAAHATERLGSLIGGVTEMRPAFEATARRLSGRR